MYTCGKVNEKERNQMYEIFTDMSADIAAEAAGAYDIKFVQMDVTVGDETFTAKEPAGLEEMHSYYDKLRNGVTTGTSQITPFNYTEAFEPYVNEGKGILYIALSGGLSKTFESASLAVTELKEKYGDKAQIEVIDSLGGTGGMGILCEAAGINRKNGMSLSENAAWLRAHAGDINYWFKVEDLMYLKRGGRISGAAAVIGTALSIKPILTIRADGRLDTIGKKRGSRLAIKYLTDCYRDSAFFGESKADESYQDGIEELTYICCADCIPDAELLKQMVLSINPDAKIRITSLSPVIGAHTGPDMLSLIHFGSGRS